MQQRKKRAVLAAVLLSAAAVAVPLAPGSTAYAGTSAPTGNTGAFQQRFLENFSTTAAANGPFAKTYAKSWQPYPDGAGGRYSASSQVSSHDGLMDVVLDGKHGTAGTFGTPTDAWTHVGGKFSVRAKATGGTGNGAAFMLWPTSGTWSDGEMDFPEGNFESTPMAFHHSMTPGHEAESTMASTGVSWRTWHVYSVEWIPGKSVTYTVDDKVVQKVTKDVPTTAHRYMFQVGNWGAKGHLFIDWVSTYDHVG